MTVGTRLVLAWVAWSGFAGWGLGQDAPSHVPIPRLEGSDPTSLFAEKILRSQRRADLEGLLQRFGGPGSSLPTQLELFKILQDNPQLRDLASSLARDLNAGDPQTRREMHDLMRDILQNNPALARLNLNPDEIARQLRDLKLPRASSSAQTGPSGTGATSLAKPKTLPDRFDAQRAEARPVDPAFQESRRAWAERIARWADQFPKDQLAKPLRESTAIRDLLRQWSTGGFAGLGSREGIDAQLARWEGQWKSLRDWLPNDLGSGVRWPEFSGVSLPDVRLPNLPMHPPSLPSGSWTMPAGAGEGWWYWLLIGLLASLLAWVLMRQRASATARARANIRKLGPWPIAPDAVATRTDVIRAFEYLSLARWGEPARAWHHRAIAERLALEQPGAGDAAQRLADFYEQARYVPEHHATDWTRAREPLGRLARDGAA